MSRPAQRRRAWRVVCRTAALQYACGMLLALLALAFTSPTVRRSTAPADTRDALSVYRSEIPPRAPTTGHDAAVWPISSSGPNATLVSVKKASRQSRIGEAGIALIHRRVTEMGHLWHPTGGLDTGIDGEIELVDPSTDETRNVRIGVQSKATEGIWRSETDVGFVYRPSSDDIEYWLASNQPVLLVCSRPKTQEAYFRNLQDWARDAARRATGLIDFDKRRDRFDGTAAARLFDLDAREPLVVEPPGPLPEPERAHTNLLPVHWDTEVISVVDAPPGAVADIFRRAHEAGVPRHEVAARDRRLWSMWPFDQAFLEAVGIEDKPEALPFAELLDSPERDDQVLVADLARRAVLRLHHRQLRWSPPLKAAYFRLWDSQPERSFKWSRGKGRTVVKERKSTRHAGISGYRHDAAHLRFRRLSGGWVMSIEPTYLFTWDGVQTSSFHAEALKKMKAQDGAAAISQQLRMWATLFTSSPSFMDGADPPLHFGSLIPVTIPVTPPEGAWAKPPLDIGEADDASAPDAALTLFDDSPAAT